MINNRSEHIAPVKGSEKLIDIKKELEALGSIKEDLLLEISKGKKLASEYNELDSLVVEKEEQLKILSTKIGDSKDILSKLDSAKQSLANVNSNLYKTTVSLESTTLNNITLLDINKTIQSDIDYKKSELGKIQKEFNDINNQLTNENLELAKQRKLLQSYIQEEDETLGRLKSKNLIEEKRYNKLLSDIKKSEELLITNKEKSDKILEEAVMEYEKIINTANIQAEKVMQDASDYKDKMDLLISDREGEVSTKEKFLLVREDFLRDVKSQLEDKLGKKIDNLVF